MRRPSIKKSVDKDSKEETAKHYLLNPSKGYESDSRNRSTVVRHKKGKCSQLNAANPSLCHSALAFWYSFFTFLHIQVTAAVLL